jgi:hypothetical protein
MRKIISIKCNMTRTFECQIQNDCEYHLEWRNNFKFVVENFHVIMHILKCAHKHNFSKFMTL